MTDRHYIEAMERGWIVSGKLRLGGLRYRCLTPGCKMQIERWGVEGADLPRCIRCKREHSLDVDVACYADIREALIEERKSFGLVQDEIDEALGVADGQIKKWETACEIKNPRRVPQVSNLIAWAQTLGFSVALIPGRLPKITQRQVQARFAPMATDLPPLSPALSQHGRRYRSSASLAKPRAMDPIHPTTGERTV